ncbi:uncharacterized protein LOC120141932 [Hibiscus syriacus]|uniref:uncharacterized protein LOC120141932 n=1 Tax=Hibiscus syriacus TaxID=106335 RepID=UPI001924FEAE|nr:uncharacterized protein LOC120141932 [Hibiscus syriacus]XP_039012631.1 uncharacterized protein LOC120141932 [Hibiscus syriacus]
MRSWNSSAVLLFFSLPFFLLVSPSASSIDHRNERIGHRVLITILSIALPLVLVFLAFTLRRATKKYRCSETGYRIPFKCVEIDDGSNAENKQKTKKDRPNLEISAINENSRKRRSLLDDSSTSESRVQAYIIYRSCIPAVNEEKLSVLGFEGIIFGLLLISGSVVFLRRKRAMTLPGVSTGRIQSNSRF